MSFNVFMLWWRWYCCCCCKTIISKFLAACCSAYCSVFVALWQRTVAKWRRSWCWSQPLRWTRWPWYCCWSWADEGCSRTFAGQNCTHYGSDQGRASIQGGWVLFVYMYIELIEYFCIDVRLLCLVSLTKFEYCFPTLSYNHGREFRNYMTSIHLNVLLLLSLPTS